MKSVISAKRSFYYNWLCELPEVQLRTMLAFINHLCWVDEMVMWAEASEIELELFDIMFQPDACCLGW